MKISFPIVTKHEPDVVLNLSSDPNFFFGTFTPFKIINFENENTFYIYGEIASTFSLVDIEAKVARFVSRTGVIYVLTVGPGLIKLPSGKELDRAFKPTPPKGNGKISVTRSGSTISMEIDYEGDREKMIVNSLAKKARSIKNLDDLIWRERISRHI
ncbi:STK_08120 family protein [Metallosphaera hakonensis]|uniref:STK_08120 family protein n=1 Tax=Metallosphaera hakonensis TaxID=79601 RepID=UPI0006D06527|nr:STK_08120 family protein [Metallosphaera hakonensis]